MQTSSQTLFFLAQWTEYHTHVLPTAMGPVGVTELQYFVMAACLLSGCLCRELVSATLSAPALADSSVSLRLAIIMTTVVVTLLSCVAFVLTVLSAPETKSATKALGQLAPIAIVALSGVSFSDAVYSDHPRALSTATGLLMVHLTNKMIVFSMAQQEFGGILTQWIALPYVGCALCLATAPQPLSLTALGVCRSAMVASHYLEGEQLQLEIYALLVRPPPPPHTPPPRPGCAV